MMVDNNKIVQDRIDKKFKSIIKIFIISVVLLVNYASAQESKFLLNEKEVELPVLHNHKFIVNNHTRSPFIKTYFNNALGYGQALDLQVPIHDIEGEPIYGLRGNLYFTMLSFEYQYAVNKWLAVWIGFDLTSRMGDGIQTLLAQGINATTDLELGWMFKLMKTNRTILSGTINLWNNSGTIINIYDFIQRIIDERGLSPDNRLITTRNFIQLGGGLRFAWAASDLIGVNLLTEFAYGEVIDRREKNELFYNLAGSIDIDLNSLVQVPIGFSIGLQMNSFIAGSDTSVKNKIGFIFFKTAYTAENDFLIGVDLIWRRIPMNQLDQTLYGGSAVLNVDYYF
ncbi:MAG: hypothetical protein ABFS12_06395 [Bacteroidota bacterium]